MARVSAQKELRVRVRAQTIDQRDKRVESREAREGSVRGTREGGAREKETTERQDGEEERRQEGEASYVCNTNSRNAS